MSDTSKSSDDRLIQIEHLKAADFVPPKDVTYYDTGMHEMCEALAFKANILLCGPKGIGKTLGMLAFASKHQTPIITFDCSEDVRRSNLIGNFILRGDETPFILGPLTTAFEVANECGSCILCLEEVNALSPQMQKVLNSISDFRRKIEVPEIGRVFKLNEGSRLWVVGTMNTAVYGGVYALNEDLKSRFRLFPLDYPSQDVEKKIVAHVVNGQAKKIGPEIIEQVIRLAHETRQKALDYALSTRDVVQIIEDILAVGKEKALWIVRGKFEGDDRTTVEARIRSIFGVQFEEKAKGVK